MVVHAGRRHLVCVRRCRWRTRLGRLLLGCLWVLARVEFLPVPEPHFLPAMVHPYLRALLCRHPSVHPRTDPGTHLSAHARADVATHAAANDEAYAAAHVVTNPVPDFQPHL